MGTLKKQIAAERPVAELTKDGQNNIDEEIGAATSLEEDSQRRKDDGEDELADVAVGKRKLLAIFHFLHVFSPFVCSMFRSNHFYQPFRLMTR